MSRLSEAKVLDDCPWEADSFMHPPKGSDKWCGTSSSTWIYRSHGKARRKSFHPIHRSFPFGDVASLTGQRVTIMFPETQGSKSVERMIFIDRYTDIQSEVGKQLYPWKGFTFFKVSRNADGSHVMPNDHFVLGDPVALHTTASTGQASAEEADEFELIV